MARLPQRFAPLIYGVIQAGITTAVATGIATAKTVGLGLAMLPVWMVSWALAWATMLPVVVIVAPMIHQAVLRFTEPPAG